MGYADGTDGWSGSDTSRERAEHDRDTGASKDRREVVIRALVRAGSTGLTWKDVAGVLVVHHGSASSVLTNLHKEGRIVRTARKRERSKVYVMEQFLRPDDVRESYHPNRNAAAERAVEAETSLARLEDVIARARMALLTGEGSTATLRILDEK